MKKPHIDTYVVRVDITHTRTSGNLDEVVCRGLEALLKDARGIKDAKARVQYSLGVDGRTPERDAV